MNIKLKILKIINLFLSKFNAIIVSKNKYEKVNEQLSEVASKYINISKKKYKVGTSCVIFSMDRPIQFYALLEGITSKLKGIDKIYVIYSCSNSSINKKYDEIISTFKSINIEFIREKNFNITILEVLEAIQTNKIFFMVDDILVLREIDFSIINSIDESKYIISLRLGKSIRYSYNLRSKINPPISTDYGFGKLLKFCWADSVAEWSDPWSFDGNIFSTSDILSLTKCSNFTNPNSYEAALKNFNLFVMKFKPLGLCFEHPTIVNLPINKVQNYNMNRHGNLDIKYMNEKWDSNKKIDISQFFNYIPSSTHEELNLSFISRNE